MKLQKMKTFLQEKPAEWILWHTSPSGVPYMGAVLECQICSEGSLLEELLETQSLVEYGNTYDWS